jgi:hypothetical protein
MALTLIAVVLRANRRLPLTSIDMATDRALHFKNQELNFGHFQVEPLWEFQLGVLINCGSTLYFFRDLLVPPLELAISLVNDYMSQIHQRVSSTMAVSEIPVPAIYWILSRGDIATYLDSFFDTVQSAQRTRHLFVQKVIHIPASIFLLFAELYTLSAITITDNLFLYAAKVWQGLLKFVSRDSVVPIEPFIFGLGAIIFILLSWWVWVVFAYYAYSHPRKTPQALVVGLGFPFASWLALHFIGLTAWQLENVAVNMQPYLLSGAEYFGPPTQAVVSETYKHLPTVISYLIIFLLAVYFAPALPSVISRWDIITSVPVFQLRFFGHVVAIIGCYNVFKVAYENADFNQALAPLETGEATLVSCISIVVKKLSTWSQPVDLDIPLVSPSPQRDTQQRSDCEDNCSDDEAISRLPEFSSKWTNRNDSKTGRSNGRRASSAVQTVSYSSPRPHSSSLQSPHQIITGKSLSNRIGQRFSTPLNLFSTFADEDVVTGTEAPPTTPQSPQTSGIRYAGALYPRISLNKVSYGERNPAVSDSGKYVSLHKPTAPIFSSPRTPPLEIHHSKTSRHSTVTSQES